MTRHSAITLIVLLALTTACRQPETESDPRQLVVTTRDFTFDAPDTVSAGPVTMSIVNEGPSPHHVVTLRVPPGRTAAAAIDSILTSGVPDWLDSMGGPEGTEDATSEHAVTAFLDAGEYILICVLPVGLGRPHYSAGMIKTLVAVESEASVAPKELLVPTDTLRLHDFKYSRLDTLKAGRVRLLLRNDGDYRHHAEILRVDQGTSMERVMEALKDIDAPQPIKSVGGSTGVSPGREALLEVTLSAGNYVIVCFLGDGLRDAMHFEVGMIQSFRVE